MTVQSRTYWKNRIFGHRTFDKNENVICSYLQTTPIIELNSTPVCILEQMFLQNVRYSLLFANSARTLLTLRSTTFVWNEQWAWHMPTFMNDVTETQHINMWSFLHEVTQGLCGCTSSGSEYRIIRLFSDSEIRTRIFFQIPEIRDGMVNLASRQYVKDCSHVSEKKSKSSYQRWWYLPAASVVPGSTYRVEPRIRPSSPPRSQLAHFP